MTEFDFSTASRIIFGSGKSQALGTLVSEYGSRALLVTGSTPSRFQTALSSLEQSQITYEIFEVIREPSTDVITQGIDHARAYACDMVIAIGGGSVIDSGKAIAALVVNRGDLLDYLEVIGKGQPLSIPSIPFIAVPTTSGTGSEVTRNAVLASHEHQVKVSLRSPSMLPRLALVDPLLTCSLPPEITATTGMDALSQVLEPYVSKMTNPFTDLFCVEGLKRAARAIKKAFDQGEDLEAREDMALASLFGGLALANAKLGAVHGIAGPLGGLVPAPHGAICARLLPFVMDMNIRALQDRAPENQAVGRYEEVSRILTGQESAKAMDGVAWVVDLCEALKINSLRAYGLKKEHFPVLIEKASVSSSMKGNPIQLTDIELQEILQKAL